MSDPHLVFDRRAVRRHRDRAAATTSRVAPILREVAERVGCPITRLVLRAEEIDWPAFEGIRKLGLTAGASAPEVLVEEIIDAFAARYTVTVDTVSTVVEDMSFPLPRELRSEAAE